MSDYLNENSVPHCRYVWPFARSRPSNKRHRYQGDMNSRERAQSIRDFMTKDKTRVILMSLKVRDIGHLPLCFANLRCTSVVVSGST
jgi:hypothetical protein